MGLGWYDYGQVSAQREVLRALDPTFNHWVLSPGTPLAELGSPFTRCNVRSHEIVRYCRRQCLGPYGILTVRSQLSNMGERLLTCFCKALLELRNGRSS